MKKIFLPLLIAILSTSWLMAQEPDSIMQPIHAVGKVINESGEVTKTYNADFEYDTEGILLTFAFPEYYLDTRLTYEDNRLKQWISLQSLAYLIYFRGQVNYAYDDKDRLIDLWGGTGINGYSDDTFYLSYEYDGQDRLGRKEKGTWKNVYSNSSKSCQYYWLYDYEDNGRTRIETEFCRHNNGNEVVFPRSKVSTSLYSEDYKLMSVQAECYSVEGEVTESTLTTYAYTETGQLAEETVQQLVDDEWVNTDITAYFYDGNRRLTEYRSGVWSDDTGDWDFTEKTVYEYDRSTMLYTISFYKKNDGIWVRDVYNASRTVFFNSDLDLHEECLKQMSYESLAVYSPSTDINQFELTMQYMTRPSFAAVDQKDEFKCGVYPNPGNNEITVNAPAENAVIRFFDLQGRLMLAKPFDFSTTIGTGDWPQGIYLWEIWNGTQKEASGKWVKE